MRRKEEFCPVAGRSLEINAIEITIVAVYLNEGDGVRILFVNHNSYTDEITGAEKSLYYDICCLLERGYDAAVLSRKQGKSTEFFRSLDVPVYICPYDSPALKKIITKVNPALVYINTIGPVRCGRGALPSVFPFCG